MALINVISPTPFALLQPNIVALPTDVYFSHLAFDVLSPDHPTMSSGIKLHSYSMSRECECNRKTFYVFFSVVPDIKQFFFFLVQAESPLYFESVTYKHLEIFSRIPRTAHKKIHLMVFLN